jgi:hypothetical protein
MRVVVKLRRDWPLRAFEHGLKAQFHIYTTLTPNLRVLGVLLALTVMSALVSSA